MKNEEIEKIADKIYQKVKNVPGVDKNFIKKCLQGISLLNDKEVEEKIRQLSKYL